MPFIMSTVMGTRVKLILPGMGPESPSRILPVSEKEQERTGVQFIADARCRDYDWLVVYDDMPRKNSGSIRHETEPLACPKEHTILITAEPPSIKLYPNCYTRQFEYVLTTHDRCYLPHRNWQRGQGCLMWMAGYSAEEVYERDDWPKSKLFSTVHSTKMMKHTQHFNRYHLTEYISKHIPEMDWFGWGKAPLDSKTTALSDYRYHLAVENYIHPYHWSDKISDPILGLCLTFYAGDPALTEIFPKECVIPIPIDDPPAALEIIRKAIRNNEYEKRLPALREARRLLITRYNIFHRVVQTIKQHQISHPETPQIGSVKIHGRHILRLNPLNLLDEGFLLLRHRLLHPVH